MELKNKENGVFGQITRIKIYIKARMPNCKFSKTRIFDIFGKSVLTEWRYRFFVQISENRYRFKCNFFIIDSNIYFIVEFWQSYVFLWQKRAKILQKKQFACICRQFGLVFPID